MCLRIFLEMKYETVQSLYVPLQMFLFLYPFFEKPYVQARRLKLKHVKGSMNLLFQFYIVKDLDFDDAGHSVLKT